MHLGKRAEKDLSMIASPTSAVAASPTYVGCFRVGIRKADTVVDFVHAERTVYGRNFDVSLHSLNRGGNEPESFSVSLEVLDQGELLRDDDVVSQRWIEGTVTPEFLSPIERFGCWREHLNDDRRIDEYIPMLVEELRLTTDDHNVRIRKQPFH
jgi:hypothetical protein